jgi:type IV pilus assembly protein PilO
MKKKKLQFSTERLEPFFDKLSKLSMLYRFLICITTYALLVAPFVWFSYLPKYEQIGKLKKEFEDLDKKLRVAQTKAQQLNRMEAILEAAKDQFDLARKKLPQEREIPDLLANITASGQEAGLQFYLFEPRAESRKDFYAEIPVSIRVEGSYEDTAMFFYRVARLSRIVNLKNISMAPKGPDKIISTSCNAVTYMFVEGK